MVLLHARFAIIAHILLVIVVAGSPLINASPIIPSLTTTTNDVQHQNEDKHLRRLADSHTSRTNHHRRNSPPQPLQKISPEVAAHLADGSRTAVLAYIKDTVIKLRNEGKDEEAAELVKAAGDVNDSLAVVAFSRTHEGVTGAELRRRFANSDRLSGWSNTDSGRVHPKLRERQARGRAVKLVNGRVDVRKFLGDVIRRVSAANGGNQPAQTGDFVKELEKVLRETEIR